MEDFFRNLGLRHTDLAKIDTAQFELYRANLRQRSDAGEFSLIGAEKRLEAVKTIFKFAHKTGVKIDDAVRKLPVNPAKGVERFGAKGSDTGKPSARRDKGCLNFAALQHVSRCTAQHLCWLFAAQCCRSPQRKYELKNADVPCAFDGSRED